MWTVLSYNFKIAYEAILANKLRAMLTSLGIICGVASVIAMLAIGKGAELEILEKMKLLGTNNIIIKPIPKSEKEKQLEESDTKARQQKRYSPGLTLADAESIFNIAPDVSSVSSEIIIETQALRNAMKRTTNLVGINSDYFNINKFNISRGNAFSEDNMMNSAQVCIIGSGIKTKLFPTENPIGKYIKCGQLWLKVIGTLEERRITKENVQDLGIRDYNYDVYIPITTMLLRYKNRSHITKRNLSASRSFDDGSSKPTAEDEKTDQLDRIIVSVNNSDNAVRVSEIVGRLILRRHNQVKDFEIIVPELLLEQEKRTKNIFNIVLGAIASISLLVGGIGIMNIMLASVLERTKEIGIRLAVGAKQNDILLQFLCEAVAISITGGFIGIIAGISVSYIIESVTGIQTIVSLFSVLLSFIVSAGVGLLFGITPARRASRQNPMELLRYE